jgi:hypothetical protein
MKYRTMIEVICDAADKEDASNTAGDYLRGKVDFGVEMKCKTVSLRSHRMRKYVVSCAAIFLLFSSVVLNTTLISGHGNISCNARPAFHSTGTIMPALKTKHRTNFKKEWEEKKDEAVLEFLKK